MKGLSVQRISHATPHYEAAVQLRRELLRWPLGLEFSSSELQAEAEEIILGAFIGEELVGTLNLVVVLSPNGLKMRQVAVRGDMQGKGVGRALVEMSEAIAREAGSGFIKLHARDTAVPFYLALGYRLEGEPFEEVGIPHRVMVKEF